MNTLYMILSGATLLIYCLINAAILTGLFGVIKPTLLSSRAWSYFLGKTLISVLVVFGFFAMIARMFCWTSTIGECLQCICPSITVDTFVMQSNMPSTILFYVSVCIVQMVLIAIPRGVKPLTFVMLIGASNFIASLLKLGLVSLWV